MNLLLDTHIALWAITDSPKLAGKARAMIESPKSSVWISAATIWEIAIKNSLGPAEMLVSGQDALCYFNDSGYRFLPVEPEYATAVDDLPPHHRDQFDRILVAQALVEPMRLMTHDPMVARDNDTIIEV